MRSERDLAGPSSHFLEVQGLTVHYTQHVPPCPDINTEAGGPYLPRLAVHCVHGLGACSFSWDGFVQGQLAARLRAVVTAHDMPGFGLTHRCGGGMLTRACRWLCSSPACRQRGASPSRHCCAAEVRRVAACPPASLAHPAGRPTAATTPRR